MSTWTIRPGIAALVTVISPEGREIIAVYLDEPIEGFPPEVRAAVNRHFRFVFSLDHEKWMGPGPSPRARYCDALVPWTVEVPDPS